MPVSDVSSMNRLLAALFAPFVFFLAMPLEIYLANEAEMSFHFGFFAGRLFTFFIVTSLILYALLQLLGRWRGVVARLLLALAICFWVSSSFFNVSYGVFNGADLAVNAFSAMAWLEVLAWGLIIAVLLLGKAEFWRYWEGGWIIFILIVLLSLNRAYQVYSTEPSMVQKVMSEVSAEALQSNFLEDLPVFSRDRNVLHVILDETQGSIARRVLEERPELADALAGFVLLSDTAGVYPYTQVSLPAVFSGEIYNNDYDMQEYLQKAYSENRFFEYLEDSGYSKQFHVHPGVCIGGYLKNCSGIAGTSASAVLFNLLDFSLLRVTPIMAAYQLYWHGEGLISNWFGEGGYLDTATGIAWLEFSAFNSRISVGEIPPAYKVFHSMVTHTPLVLNDTCELLPKKSAVTLTASSEQIACGFSLLINMLAAMHEQGVLDNTLIIVSSDHGGNHVPKRYEQTLDDKQISPADFSRADAFLMVKSFNASGKIQYVNEPLQLNQIGELIRRLHQQPTEVRKVAEQLAGVNSVRRFNSLEMGLSKDFEHELPGFASYCIEGPVTDPASWRVLDPGSETGCQVSQ